MGRVPAKSFRDLVVWQKAHRLVLEVYRFSNHFRDTPPDADPVGTARASLPHDRTLLLHRSFLDTQMLPFTYPRPDTSTVSTTDYPSAAMY